MDVAEGALVDEDDHGTADSFVSSITKREKQNLQARRSDGSDGDPFVGIGAGAGGRSKKQGNGAGKRSRAHGPKARFEEVADPEDGSGDAADQPEADMAGGGKRTIEPEVEDEDEHADDVPITVRNRGSEKGTGKCKGKSKGKGKDKGKDQGKAPAPEQVHAEDPSPVRSNRTSASVGAGAGAAVDAGAGAKVSSKRRKSEGKSEKKKKNTDDGRRPAGGAPNGGYLGKERSDYVFWKTTRKTTVVRRYVRVEEHSVSFDGNNRPIGAPILKSMVCNQLSQEDPLIEETKCNVKLVAVDWQTTLQAAQVHQKTIATQAPLTDPSAPLPTAESVLQNRRQSAEATFGFLGGNKSYAEDVSSAAKETATGRTSASGRAGGAGTGVRGTGWAGTAGESGSAKSSGGGSRLPGFPVASAMPAFPLAVVAGAGKASKKSAAVAAAAAATSAGSKRQGTPFEKKAKSPHAAAAAAAETAAALSKSKLKGIGKSIPSKKNADDLNTPAKRRRITQGDDAGPAVATTPKQGISRLSNADSGGFRVGEEVMAKWQGDRFYYHGTVASIKVAATGDAAAVYNIMYSDSTKTRTSQVRSAALRVGTQVHAKRRRDPDFSPGVVVSAGKSSVYNVRFEDEGDEHAVSIKDIALTNLVTGNDEDDSIPFSPEDKILSPTKDHTHSASGGEGGGGGGGGGGGASGSGKKAVARAAAEKAKPATKRSLIPPVQRDCACSFKHPSTTPETLIGPIPAGDPPQLLTGYFFVLTGGGADPAPRKGHLSCQINALGGSVVDDVKATLDALDDQDGEPTDFVVVLSDQVRRTQKYFHAMAADVPCIRFSWIADLCKSVVDGKYKVGRTAPVKLPTTPAPGKRDYVLTRGTAPDVFAQTWVMIIGEAGFCENWSKTLGIAGARIIYKDSARHLYNDADASSQAHLQCDYVLLEKNNKLPEKNGKMPARCAQFNVPAVTSDWVIQCLQAGALVSTDK
jgi:hypothetical protein